MKIEEVKMLDITKPEIMEILISSDRKTVWVNVNEICVLRVTRIKELVFQDESQDESQGLIEAKL